MKAAWYWRLLWWPADWDRVSAEWLHEHAQAETKVGIDQSGIQWPIDKVTDSQAWRQTSRLRKRA